MKQLLVLFWFCSVICLTAQPGLYRHYPQPQPQGMAYASNPQKPVPTADGGYLISNWILNMGFETPGGLGNSVTIKTDSSFVPQWKKNYPNAVALPTGAIILFGPNAIEKVTASGVQVWIKYLTTPIYLTDAVVYGNKIRFVGTLRSFVYLNAMPAYTGDGFTLLTDTSGTYTSHKLFHSSLVNTNIIGTYRASADFSKVKRDAQGNFFVYSNQNTMAGMGSQMSIAKFDTSFSFVWAKTWSAVNQLTLISDIDILPNGRIFASAITPGNSSSWWNPRASLLKMDAQGNLLAQCFFENRYSASSFTKKINGNYVMGINTNDSLFMLETDTSMNVSWFKFTGKGKAIGESVIRNNRLYTPMCYGNDVVLISNDLSGNSCASYSMSYSKPTTTITLVNFTLAPVSYTTAIVSGTLNSIASQAYIDSCRCPVFISTMQNNLCVGNTGTINIVGTGNLSWYASATGNSFIQSGPQFTFTSSTATTVTVYAQDSACASNPNRTAVSITVHAVPTLSFSPANPMICVGQQVFVWALGAANYTWSHNLPVSSVQNLNPLTTTVYTVTGSLAPGCNDTKTVAVTVVPVPTITASSSGPVCVGQTATISASGGNSYNWSIGQTVSSFTVSPTYAGQFNYNVAGSNGACNGYATATLVAMANPAVSLISNPSVLCSGMTATITASGATTYSWSNGSTGPNLLATPSANTTYIITGNNGGCVGSATIALAVQAPPVVSAFASSTVVCTGAPVSFSATGANTYTWSNNLTTATFSINVPAGIAIYTVTGSDGTCTSSSTVSANGVPIPTITISNPSVLCLGTTATLTASGASSYSWTNGSNSSTFTINPVTTGQYTFAVTGSNGSCSNVAQTIITALVTPTILTAYSPALPCAGDSVTITATGASTYSWNNGWTGSILLVNPSVNTTYVIWGATNGCNSTKNITIPVQPLPAVTVASSASAVCIGAPVTLTASGANSYTWSNGIINSTIIFSPTVTTVYSVTGMANNSCINSATGTVVVNPSPALFISTTSSLICSGENVTLNASGATLYIWNTGNVGANIIVNPTTTTTYTLHGTSQEGCQSSLVFTQSVSVCSMIKKETNQSTIQVIPNPTSGHIQILLDSDYSDLNLQVIDATGGLVYSSLIENENPGFDISEHAPGLYTICVYQHNALLFHKKVVKE